MTDGCRIEIHEIERVPSLPLMMQLDYWNGVGIGSRIMRTRRTSTHRVPVWVVVAVGAYFTFFGTLFTAFGVTFFSYR